MEERYDLRSSIIASLNLSISPRHRQVLSAWALYELAHHQYHTCDSQEKPGVNRTAKGNAGDEPRFRQTIQEEEAETEQSCADSSKWCQPLDKPVAVHEHRRAPASEVAPCKRAKQCNQTSGYESQPCERLAGLNEVAEEHCIRRYESLQDSSEEADQVATLI